MEQIIETRRTARDPALDLMKLILAVLVVMIHAEVEVGLLTPLLWTSVPLFFMTSSYFFFKKCAAAASGAEKTAYFWRFLRRNMVLYGFWFVLLLPVTVYLRGWYSGPFLPKLAGALQAFLFNSTFRGSWYIMALNIATGLVLLASGKISNRGLLLLACPAYLLCCLFSNYYGLIADVPVVTGLYEAYLRVFCSLNNSFPAGLLWIVLGKLLAERELPLSRGQRLAMAALSVVLLLLEHWLVEFYQLPKTHNAYVFLVPLCVAVFSLVQSWPLPAWEAPRLGQVSTVLYASHASVVSVVGAVVRRAVPLNANAVQWITFLLTILICAGICALIFMLEKRRGFHWLRYGY